MYEDFKNRYSCSLQAIDTEGHKIALQFFSHYRPEESKQKAIDIWAYDLICLDDYDKPIKFLWGNNSFIHPVSRKKYTIIYSEIRK
ncbi:MULTISPECIES: hypothetical protein [Acinetobacter]|jgi:hypothetical protein|uniref:Uncharacterized protein n=1 Tax=Acinetobacter bereziniae NIPH 3 TaxID=1217651 RepID=N8YI25_ACIBZ|nr:MULTISPECIES: hypothetical protein [Acinetobacter]ENV20934.1 hypothetical protein F963_03065 [Acinetobacter bereziniae NIPH 3]MDR3027243.1 hypothetical protein [Acinetobacter sp.]